MITSVLSPEFAHLQPFFHSICSKFDTEGEVIFSKRNQIKVFNIDGLKISVKCFKVPSLFNRLVYSFFRASKAERSYKHGLRVASLGITTPTPIGYIEEKQFGIIRRSYYVCAYQPYRATITGILGSKDDDREIIISEFTRFTFTKLHQQGVLHKDYSGGNILVENLGEGSYRFSIIDLNRMSFKKKISTKLGLKNLRRLTLDITVNDIVAITSEYASVAGNSNPKQTLFWFLKYHLGFTRFKNFKSWYGKYKIGKRRRPKQRIY